MGTGSSTELSSRLRVHVCSQSLILQVSLNSMQLQIVLFISTWTAYVKASSGKPRKLLLRCQAQRRYALVGFRRSSRGWSADPSALGLGETPAFAPNSEALDSLQDLSLACLYCAFGQALPARNHTPRSPLFFCSLELLAEGKDRFKHFTVSLLLKCRKGLLSPGAHGCGGTAGSLQWNIGYEIVAPVPETYPGSSGAWSSLLRCCHAINTW